MGFSKLDDFRVLITYGTLCRSEQSHQVPGIVSTVDRPNHGGIFPAGRQRAGEGMEISPMCDKHTASDGKIPGI